MPFKNLLSLITSNFIVLLTTNTCKSFPSVAEDMNLYLNSVHLFDYIYYTTHEFSRFSTNHNKAQ